MPLESITCTSCGATDVQEVKADTYFCNHCEGVFRYARPRGSGGPAVCEIDGCGVAAVGRCLSCGKTICTTHQAKRAIHSPLMSMVEPVDCCIECEDQQRIAKERAAEAACRDSETAVCRCCGSRFRPTPELRPTGPGGTGYDPLANWSRDHRKPPQLPQQYRIMALKVTSIGLTGADSFAVTLPTGICEACASEGVAQLETIVSAEYAGLLEEAGKAPYQAFAPATPRPQFVVIAMERGRPKSRAQKGENDKAVATADRFSSELSERLEVRMNGRSCVRTAQPSARQDADLP